MHTLYCRFCIPKIPERSSNFRSAPKVNKFKLFVLESTVPLGFCCGGLSSTAGYVPGNEAQKFLSKPERRSTHLADHFQRALFVFIRTTRNVRRHFQQAFRLQLGALITDPIRSSLPSNAASPHRLPLPVPVKMPVSNFDYEWSLHPKFPMSSTIYFNFRPVFIGVLWKNCGYHMWIKCGNRRQRFRVLN